MAKLLCDLSKDNARPQPGGQLTQAALDSYEKQLGTAQCPASTSIISYLKRLEMDQVIPSSSDQPHPAVSTYKKGLALTSDSSGDLLIGNGHMNYQRPEPTVASSPQKLQAGENSQSCSLMGDEYKPDETTYLPLASSPHKANFGPSVRAMCTPPKICTTERDIGSSKDISLVLKRNQPTQRSLFNAPDTFDKPTEIREANVPKPGESSGGPPPLLHHLRNLQISNPRLNVQSTFDVMTAESDWSIASFSTFTSHDEQDFRSGLAALDANIAKLQRTLQSGK